jgi:hypothetical protein
MRKENKKDAFFFYDKEEICLEGNERQDTLDGATEELFTATEKTNGTIP